MTEIKKEIKRMMDSPNKYYLIDGITDGEAIRVINIIGKVDAPPELKLMWIKSLIENHITLQQILTVLNKYF